MTGMHTPPVGMKPANLHYAASAKTSAAKAQDVTFKGSSRADASNTVTVTGSGQVFKDPDTVTTTLSLQETLDVTPELPAEQARQQLDGMLNSKSEALNKALDELGFANLERKSSFNRPYAERNWQDPTHPIIRYHGSYTLNVTIRGGKPEELPNQLARIKDVADGLGVVFQSGNPSLSSKEEAELEALELAVKNARAQAERSAKALGIQLEDKPEQVIIGAPVHSAYEADYGYAEAMPMMATARSARASADSFKQGKIKVNAPSVTVRFKIKK